VRRNPLVIKDYLEAKVFSVKYKNEIRNTISYFKKKSPYHIQPDDNLSLSRLCNVEDWENIHLKRTITELKRRKVGIIHRKDWEWALGLVAMTRFNKLNKNNTALGVGSGKEDIVFYLANFLGHVYATDLYEGKAWKEAASDFPENPKKYAPFPYSERALTVLRMDGTKLDFPSESFDVAFSFSSIEHFGGIGHSGSLKALREIERVLRRKGIAVIATEYIINDKEHCEFFNRHSIYSDLIDRVEGLKLVEPLDLRITSNTLDLNMEYYSTALKWDNMDDEFKENHPHILLRKKAMLWTSAMLVFQKQ
jgi:SAM-dependent methyltransferase